LAHQLALIGVTIKPGFKIRHSFLLHVFRRERARGNVANFTPLVLRNSSGAFFFNRAISVLGFFISLLFWWFVPQRTMSEAMTFAANFAKREIHLCETQFDQTIAARAALAQPGAAAAATGCSTAWRETAAAAIAAIAAVGRSTRTMGVGGSVTAGCRRTRATATTTTGIRSSRASPAAKVGGADGADATRRRASRGTADTAAADTSACSGLCVR
jgi:hypothetical protein